ncbi:MAG: hypothetical protein ACK5V3_06605, partial [Bdellovibrionales bacterium]
FKKSDDGPTKSELRKIDEQERRIQKMQNAITEIVQENIDLKKSLGDSVQDLILTKSNSPGISFYIF